MSRYGPLGPSEAVLARDLDPVLSPDGEKIAFVSDRDGNREIYLMDANGTTPVRLTTHVAGDIQPAFSPDGSRIVFASYRVDHDAGLSVLVPDLWIMNADGTSPQRLTFTNSGAGTPTFSPDGGHIAFASTRTGNDDIYLIEADGSDEVRLTADPALDRGPKFGI